MFLLFGIRMTSALLTTLVYTCDTCGQNVAHHLVKRVRQLTVFFVPLFPVSTKYVDTCTHCGRDLQVPRERAEVALTQHHQPAQGQ